MNFALRVCGRFLKTDNIVSYYIIDVSEDLYHLLDRRVRHVYPVHHQPRDDQHKYRQLYSPYHPPIDRTATEIVHQPEPFSHRR